MKSGFWQIQIAEKDRYKTAFVVPFGHYEWNFVETVKSNGLSLSATKINLFQTKVRFLGHHIHQGTFTPIQRSIEFADKFPDEIKDKKQLQRFLGSLNYVSDFIQDLSQLCAPLRQRLKKNPVPWNEDHTKIVKIVKSRVKTLPCLALADHKAFKIVETDASDIGFGGILKQRSNNQELLGSTSDPNPPVLKHPSSPVVEEGNISGSLPLVEEPIPLDFSTFDTNPLSVHKSICDLQARNEILSTLKPDDIYQLICEKAKSSAEEKQVFISAYLQDLHIYLSAIPGLSVPGLNLTKEMEFDGSKLCRNCTEPLLHQQDNKPICNCNRNFTISRACIDLQYYQPINLAFKGEVLILTPEKLLDYGLVYQLICSDPSQASNFGRRGKILPAQHYVNLHYQNRRPTLLSSPLVQTDICAEPIIKQIKHWKARVISRDFEAYPKNMGHLIAADFLHQIFCSKKIDHLPFKSTIQDTQLLMDHRSEYIPP
ncbi:Enzymatic polyprotein [Vitis vinifera]|uniref:Enzymatic polyprotein n=1 Tax=Vitis vinifera TaxID=29760 RepID=A0A438BQH5_VITVI|nr:Enzymatic polyprotein [Vitis vinifera]